MTMYLAYRMCVQTTLELAQWSQKSISFGQQEKDQTSNKKHEQSHLLNILYPLTQNLRSESWQFHDELRHVF